jgi:hypothetical protein
MVGAEKRRLHFMALVLVDAENVRRSLWPNLSREELVERSNAWAEREGHEVWIVFEGELSADDEIAAVAAAHKGAQLWVVTSDRELRRRVDPYADRIVGGGAFARML